MAKVIIIGAGLSGLSAAYHLEKKGFHDYLIVEKEAHPGGLCRSIKHGEFIFDFTGHLLHSNNPYFSSLLVQLLGDNVNTIMRRSFIYSHKIYTPYPYQVNLHGLPLKTILDCIEGFVKRKVSKKNPKLFTEWVLKNFGRGFAYSFFFPYQRKLLQYDVRKLSASWIGRFVPQTSLRQMLAGALHNNEENIGYNATFLYPRRGGIQYMSDQFVKKLDTQVITNCSVSTIDLKKRIITFKNGESISFDLIINTMPLDELLLCFDGCSSTNLVQSANKLLCTSVICLNLGIKRSSFSDKQWIYYPEKQYPFYRLGFYNTFSPALVPDGCSSMYVECSYRNKSGRSIKNIVQAARAEVKKLFNLSEDEIVVENILLMPHAYVIYDFWREQNLAKLLARLEQEGIYSIGRYGAWKYASMQEAVLDGRNVAHKIIVQPARRNIFSLEHDKHKHDKRQPRRPTALSR
jgi:protoporphyrinogen oxidase